MTAVASGLMEKCWREGGRRGPVIIHYIVHGMVWYGMCGEEKEKERKVYLNSA